MERISIHRIAVAVACAAPVLASATLLGPTPYLSIADSPFIGGTYTYSYLENFEDHLLNVPGVTGDNGGVTSVVFGPAIHDSVDADDGVIDGSGLNGDDWFTREGADGVTWTFDANILGHLPTHAGIVWTDGTNDIHFEAFDQDGNSLGTLSGSHADGSFNGETDEDRFYGAINPTGISKIHLWGGSGGIEMDHLQYGYASVPEPATMAVLGLGVLGLIQRRRSAR